MPKVLLANASLLASLLGNEDGASGLARTRPGTDKHALPMGNYVIAKPHLGNCMIAGTADPMCDMTHAPRCSVTSTVRSVDYRSACI